VRAPPSAVTHVDDRRIRDQVDAADCDAVHRGADHLLDGGADFVLVGVGAVEDEGLLARAAQQGGAVDGREHADDERDEPGAEPGEAGGEAGDQPDGKGGEVVGHLALLDLTRAQADDREDPEQAQPEAGADRCPGQDHRHGQHSHIDADEGDGEVTAAMTGVVDAECEHGDGGQIEGDGGEQVHENS